MEYGLAHAVMMAGSPIYPRLQKVPASKGLRLDGIMGLLLLIGYSLVVEVGEPEVDGTLHVPHHRDRGVVVAGHGRDHGKGHGREGDLAAWKMKTPPPEKKGQNSRRGRNSVRVGEEGCGDAVMRRRGREDGGTRAQLRRLPR